MSFTVDCYSPCSHILRCRCQPLYSLEIQSTTLPNQVSLEILNFSTAPVLYLDFFFFRQEYEDQTKLQDRFIVN